MARIRPSGLASTKIHLDSRGPRHWFIRKFATTAGPVQGVKVTLANAVERGYKVVDAVQLIGE